jgi:AraC-like DNA-binding protein
MYAQQSIQDTLFLLFYGGITILALVAGIYLWLRRSNALAPDVTAPKALRLWTAAFFLMVALSHVWWYVLGVYWLTDDRIVRNMVAVTLDHITFVPLVMALLLRMLQDRRRRLWPWVLSQLPILVAAAVGIANHDVFYGFDATTYWQRGVMTIFLVYYIYALIQYGRWLHENYADLEHKEVWQSLLFVASLFVVYEFYFTNPGEMAREYLAQVETLAIIIFLLWRVETLQELDAKEVEADEMEAEAANTNVTIPSNIGSLLLVYCEAPQLYLQHDLTLTQLAGVIGTNRTYLSQYFAQQGMTYNTYINRLRIDHFEYLYNEAVQAHRSLTAQQLAVESGFKSYSTFAAVFKQFKGQTVSAWMKEETDL